MKNRLSLKLLFYIVLCSLVFTLVTTAFQLYMEYRRDMAGVYENVQLLKKSYLKAIATSAYHMDEEQLRLQLQGALNLHDIDYLEIIESRATGEVIIAAQGNPNAKKDIVRDFMLDYTSAPDGTVQSATLRVTTSLETVHQHLWSKAPIILATNTGKAIVALFFIFFIVQFLITRHITKIANYTKQLDLDTLDQELFLDRGTNKSSKPDELDQLTTAFNSLRVRLAKDIEERRQADNVIRENEEKYRSLAETVVDMIFTLDYEGTFTYLNPAFERVTGYAVEDFIGRSFTEIITPEYIDSTVEIFKRGISGEPTPVYQVEIKHKDGGSVPVEVNVTTLMNADGTPTGRIGIARDFTERKQANEALQKSEERYRTILKNTGTAMMIVDEDKTIVFSNTELAQLFGYSREEIEGKRKWTEFVVKEDLEKMEEYHRLRRVDPASAPRNYEFRFVDKYGDIKDSFITVSVIPGTGRSVASFIDITDRKQAEKALEEYAGKYRSLTETVVDVIYTLDSKGMFTYLSPAFERITGYAVEDFIGRSFTEIITPEYIDSTVEIFKRGLSGEPTPAYDVEFKHKDRGSLPVELHASTLLNADGTPTGRIGIARDITDRKRAEDKIKESLREKEVLLQEMHHRVKNNMQIISSLLNLQSEYIKDKESLEMFNESRNRIFSMASVHEKLYQSGDLTKIDLDGYIKSLSRNLLLTYSIKRRVIKMKTNCSDIFLDINNAVPCGLIINELISNSLKHAFPEDREGEITVDFHPDGDNRLILAVSDNGVGFAEDVDINNVKTLGLHLVRALVTQLKGTLEIKNDCGTAFKITFAP
jgi:PAS domain S-box-containing protein